jgi:anti-anti-sigma factor
VQGDELQLFVSSPIIASNCSSARAALQQHSLRAASPVMIMDLEKCMYMDTQGLSVVFEFRKKASEAGRRTIVQNPSRAVQRILNITGMHRAFEIRHTSVDLERIPAAKPVASQDKDTILLPKK